MKCHCCFTARLLMKNMCLIRCNFRTSATFSCLRNYVFLVARLSFCLNILKVCEHGILETVSEFHQIYSFDAVGD